MYSRRATTHVQRLATSLGRPYRSCRSARQVSSLSNTSAISPSRRPQHQHLPASHNAFHILTPRRAQPQSADAVMENLTDLYSTAKDEFEIAAEETEKKTVYAEDDRDAAKEALNLLKEAYEKAVRESDPETAQEVQRRTGPRIRELENALTAVEEMAMED